MNALALVSARCGRLALTAAFWTLVVVVAGIGLLGHLAPLAGHELLAVRSGSMAPAIPTGAMVAVDTSGTRDPAPGDVVAFRLPGGQLVVHRVVGVTPDGRGLTTQGDANDAPDPWPVARDQVVGTIGWRLPTVGYLLGMLGMVSGIVTILCLAGTLLCAAWLLEDLEAELAELLAEPQPRAHRGPALGHSARRLR